MRIWFEDRGRGNPLRLQLQLELGGRMLQRIVGGVMGTNFGVKVAQNPNADGVVHGVILIEKDLPLRGGR